MSKRIIATLLILVGPIWFAVTLMLAPCIQLPSSCPPQSAETNPILIIFGLYVYVLGYFLAIPLTLIGIILMIRETKISKNRKHLLLGIIIFALAVYVIILGSLLIGYPTAVVSTTHTQTVSTTCTQSGWSVTCQKG